MANPVEHSFTEANEFLKSSAGGGKPLQIDRFETKSLMLVVGGSGSYTIEVSNDGSTWKAVSAALVAGASPHLITTENGVTLPFLPRKVKFMRIVTATFNSGDHGDFLGEDPG